MLGFGKVIVWKFGFMIEVMLLYELINISVHPKQYFE